LPHFRVSTRRLTLGVSRPYQENKDTDNGKIW